MRVIESESKDLKKAKDELKNLGVTIKYDKETEEFIVNLKGGKEDTAYSTDDVEDAIKTGKAMAKKKESVDIIELQHEVIIEQEKERVILEKGDKIRVLESTEENPKEWDFVILRKVSDSRGRVDILAVGEEIQGTVDAVDKTSNGLRIKLIIDMEGKPNYGVFFVPSDYRIVYINGERYEGKFD